MHAEVVSDAPGKCPICGMTLAPVRLALVWSCSVHPEVTKPAARPLSEVRPRPVPRHQGADVHLPRPPEDRRDRSGPLSDLQADAGDEVHHPSARRSQSEARRIVLHGVEQLAPRGHASGRGRLPSLHLRRLFRSRSRRPASPRAWSRRPIRRASARRSRFRSPRRRAATMRRACRAARSPRPSRPRSASSRRQGIPFRLLLPGLLERTPGAPRAHRHSEINRHSA